MAKTAVIIGAGPAGLTAAYELATRTDIKPVVIEQSHRMGGISATINHNGNRMDIGGHRFFSKSDRVMDWWLTILPMQKPGNEGAGSIITYRRATRRAGRRQNGPDPAENDRVMLLRKRVSRILYNRRFFDYPVTLNRNTFRNLGAIRILGIALSYLRVKLVPVKPEKSLEDFLINRFGRKLYNTFFRDYTEKVWGVPCNEIKPEWGAQRIKGLSVTRVLRNAVSGLFASKHSIDQKKKETSLIEYFLYPKFGPGQMWEETARLIIERGGEILTGHKAVKLLSGEEHIRGIVAKETASGNERIIEADFCFSSMPVKELIAGLGDVVPAQVKKIAEGLVYRDFITVGLLLDEIRGTNPGSPGAIPDCWIYVQENDVKLGRIQIFNNWSPYMVGNRDKWWIGLEYFCNEDDDLWKKNDEEMIDFALEELERIGFAKRMHFRDAKVIRMPKTYPAYFGSYDRFEEIRTFTDRFNNLFLTGRNGMHKYNNQDHSMLTAMVAVDNIINGRQSKDNIWSVNTEQEYHESKDGITEDQRTR